MDARTKVLLDLLPEGAVFRHTYSEDALWCPDNRGYVNERDPLRAGLYQPDGYYAPWGPPAEIECSACGGTGESEDELPDGYDVAEFESCEHCSGSGYVPNPNPDKRPNDHSFTIDAAEKLSDYRIQDGTPLALLIDALINARNGLVAQPAIFSARAAMHEVGLIDSADSASGMSSADAIRQLAAERDLARVEHVVSALTVRILANGGATSFDEMAERLYPGAGLRLPDDEPDASPDAG